MNNTILVSTRKGLFRVGRKNGNWDIEGVDFLGDNVSLTLAPGFGSGSYTENFRVWIDFNHDSVFSDSELVYAGASSGTISSTFTVPASALSGQTRMRVSMKYGGSPTACETFTYGEVEDYTVTIP